MHFVKMEEGFQTNSSLSARNFLLTAAGILLANSLSSEVINRVEFDRTCQKGVFKEGLGDMS
jgi:hypothetical protein